MGARRNATVAIIGPGRIGQAMGKLLRDAGVPICFIAARQLARARKAVRFIGGGRPLSLKDRQLADADVVLVTMSDAALDPTARRLARYRSDWSGRVVLHTCGSLPSSVLDPFRKRGASIGSLHPYQTVPSPMAGVRNLPDCFWAVEGDTRAVALARRWVKALGGKSFEIVPESKALYHLTAFLVCPTVVSLMDCSERLLQQAGVPRKIIRPMLGNFVSETVRNFIEFGGRKSLTGPAVRGDWTTLDRHLDELRRFAPEVIPAYIELVNLMLRVAGGAPHSKRGSKYKFAPAKLAPERAVEHKNKKAGNASPPF